MYSGIRKIQNDEPLLTRVEATGDILATMFKRPASVLGWGVQVLVAFGAETTNGVLALDHDPLASARVEKDSFTIADSQAVAVIERSELMRGRSPVSPNAVLAAFDVVEADIVAVEVTTANSDGAGSVLAYILIADKGSP